MATASHSLQRAKILSDFQVKSFSDKNNNSIVLFVCFQERTGMNIEDAIDFLELYDWKLDVIHLT